MSRNGVVKKQITGGHAFKRSFHLFAELGFDTSILYAAKDVTGIQTIEIPHSDYDGMNGLVKLLTDKGQITETSFPPVPPRDESGFLVKWFKRIIQFFRVLVQFSRKSREWKEKPRCESTIVCDWIFLSEEETQKTRQSAKKRGVSVNSHLLHSLNGAVRPYLEPSEKDNSTWIVPVSLYESFEEAKAPGIKTSIMEVNLADNDTAEIVHAKVKKEVDLQSYWGTIVAVLLNDFLSDNLNRKILASTVAKKKRVGTFSNLGRWCGKEEKGFVGWAVVPPVHPGQPLGVGAVEYNGALGVGMKWDPCLGMTKSDRETVKNSFKAYCVSEV